MTELLPTAPGRRWDLMRVWAVNEKLWRTAITFHWPRCVFVCVCVCVCVCVYRAWLGYVRLKKKNVCISVCICEWVCFLPFWPQLYPDGLRAQCAKLTETRQRHSPGVSELEEHCGLTHNNTDPQESHPIKCPPRLHCTGARVFTEYI